MSTLVSVAGNSYSVPQEGDSGWATDVTNLLIQLATSTKVLQVSSTTFSLTQDLSFGTSYGLKAQYIKSQAVNPASTGVLRLGNAEFIKWRNAANNADLGLTLNASNALQFNGSSLISAGAASIVNADVSASAAIAYSKIALANSVVNADIAAAAAIAYSKLNLATSILNADISASAAIAYSKLNLATSIVNADVSASAAIAYSKLNLATSILNADINVSAAIALSKLAPVTASRALVADASGFVSASAITATEQSYLSGVTSAIQTQISAKQDASTAVTLTGTQTLTNKTLTSPAINTPTGIAKSDVGLSLVDNTSDATKNSASVILTNKDIDGATASNTSRITLPKAAKTTLDALTRKAGTILFDTTSSKPYYDDGTNLQLVGSGSGGATNFITGGDAESGTTGWTVDSFAAAARPAGALTGVGTGVTFTSSSTAPLAGTNSFLYAKDAVNRQGRVVYTGITITPAYYAKSLQVSADYLVSSGTFVAGTSTTDSDVIFYLQDVTNSTFIEPSSIKLLSNSTTISDKFNATFQTSATGTSYRLLMYVASTSASAFTLKIDNIAITPSTYVFGTPITDWAAYTPTFTGFGTPTNISFKSRKVGDTLQVVGSFTPGTVTATQAQITVGYGGANANVTIDSAKLPGASGIIGVVGFNSATTTYFGSYVLSPTTNTNYILFGQQLSAQSALTTVNGNSFTTSVNLSVEYQVPIVGWSSSVQTSDQTDTRVVSFTGTQSSQALTANVTNAAFTSTKDSHGAWNGTQYVVSVAGDYILTASAACSALGTLHGYINGVQLGGFSTASAASYTSAGSVLFSNCKSGDLLSVRSDVSLTISSGTISIFRITGPSAIAATESVNARYTSAAGQTITTSTATIVDFATKTYDSHSLVTTGASWKWTANISGKIDIQSSVSFTFTPTAQANLYLSIFKNGVEYKRGPVTAVEQTAGANIYAVSVNDKVDVIASDFVDIRVFQNSGASRALDATAVSTTIALARVGN